MSSTSGVVSPDGRWLAYLAVYRAPMRYGLRRTPLEKDPLENIEHTLTIRYVMKNGVLYDGETLATLWPARSRGSFVSSHH